MSGLNCSDLSGVGVYPSPEIQSRLSKEIEIAACNVGIQNAKKRQEADQTEGGNAPALSE
jgi:ABC-type thiamine transport system ATPase subunit